MIAKRSSLSNSLAFALFLILPMGSAMGSYVASKSILMVAYFIIGLTVLFVALRSNTDQRDSYLLLLIWSASLSLLISSALVSQNLRGYDINDEYFTSSQVLAAGKWSIQNSDVYNSVLSITLLPPIAGLVSGLDGLTIHRLLLPLTYSIVPVVLYKIYKKILSPRSAFFSVFLFMSFPTFYDEMIQLGRQEVAEVILVLLLLIMLSRNLNKSFSGGVALIVLTIGLATSHYALAYIYVFFLGFSLLISRISRRASALCPTTVFVITVVAVFSWYAYVAGGIGITELSSAISHALDATIRDFLNPNSRPGVLLVATGLAPGLPGALHEINRATQYVVQLLLVLGFMVGVVRTHKDPIEKQMLGLMGVGFVFLVAAVVMPFLAASLQLTRIYHITLVFISPCLVYGITVTVSTFKRASLKLHGLARAKRYLRVPCRTNVSAKALLAAVILLSYFLFGSGWVWAMTMDSPTSLILEPDRVRTSGDPALVRMYYQDFTTSTDIAGARWLVRYRTFDRPTCADLVAKFHVLNSYGDIPRTGPGEADTMPYSCDFLGSYVYFSEYNNIFGLGQQSGEFTPNHGEFSISSILPKLLHAERVFSDGGAVVLA